MKNNKKVFQGLINYGTQAGLIARGLREHGWDATSYVWEDPYKRKIDHVIKDEFSKNWFIRKIQHALFFIKTFHSYDIFHFYYAKTILPYKIDLPLYKIFGKKVVMEYLGNDVDLWLGYNGVDYKGRPTDRIKVIKRVKRQARLCNKQLVCAPYYYSFVDNSIILPLALDLSNYVFTPRKNDSGILTIMHCPTNRIAKKTDYIENALNKLKQEGFNFNYKCIENVTHAQLKEEFLTSDIVIDQLNGWYGTTTVEAAALGRPVIAGYYPHLCHYDKRFENMPIINADIYNIYNVLKDILEGKYDLELIGKQSREFVERAHSLDAVTEQLISIYESL